MHVKPIRIEPVNTNGIVRALVPVQSLEVRKNYQNAWFFRLAGELWNCVDKGWKIGFFTLTYNDKHLPFIPRDLFANDTPYEPIQCFDRNHIRTFVRGVRKWFFDNYQIKNIKYLVASEFGEHTQRSHYHGLIAWPTYAEFVDKDTGEVTRESRDISARDVHGAIKKYWSIPHKHLDKKTHLLRTDYEPLGYLFPKDYQGGYDSHGYYHKPFELDSNPVKAARYASKYVCKDFAFLDKLKDKHILKEFGDIKFRDYDCFHIQSKSLGLSILENATDEQKLDWIKNGYWFVGQDKPVDIPIYIRNKILFDPYYIVDEQGNRLVRRVCTKFFIENYQEIFDKKVDIMEKQFVNMFDWQWWYKQIKRSDYSEQRNNDVTDLCWRNYITFMEDYGFTARDLASRYISRFGCDPDTLYHVPDSMQWLARYLYDNVLAGNPHADPDEHCIWQRRLERILSATRYFNDLDEKTDQQFNHKIQDYWKSTG